MPSSLGHAALISHPVLVNLLHDNNDAINGNGIQVPPRLYGTPWDSESKRETSSLLKTGCPPDSKLTHSEGPATNLNK